MVFMVIMFILLLLLYYCALSEHVYLNISYQFKYFKNYCHVVTKVTISDMLGLVVLGATQDTTQSAMHAEQGVTHVEQGATHAEQGDMRVIQSATHVRQGATHVRQGATHAGQGDPHVEQCVMHVEQGATHVRQSATHVRQGARRPKRQITPTVNACQPVVKRARTADSIKSEPFSHGAPEDLIGTPGKLNCILVCVRLSAFLNHS